jgi:hypothetical protein
MVAKSRQPGRPTPPPILAENAQLKPAGRTLSAPEMPCKRGNYISRRGKLLMN